MYRFIALILILFFYNFSFADNTASSGIITGTVLDKGLKTAVEYANIAIYSKSDSTIVTGGITDQKGFFKITNLPYGNYYLIANFIGYNKKTVSDISITKAEKEINLGTIYLLQAVSKLADVEVAGERNYVDYKVDKKIVNVSQHINAAGGTAADVLENVPSVKVDLEGNLSMRGSGDFTVLIDGRPSPLSGSDLLKQLPAEAIESIEIITNPSAKYDPDGTSGIINIITKKNKLNGFNGLVSADGNSNLGYSGSANLNYRKNKVNLFLNSSYRMHKNIMTSENNRETYFSDTTGILLESSDRKQYMRPYRVNLGADYYANDNNMFTVSATFGGFGYFRYFDTKYHEYTQPNTINNYSISNNDFEVDGIYYSGNIFYQHKFKEKDHKLEFTANSWQWIGDNVEESYQQASDEKFDATGAAIRKRSLHIPIRNNFKGKVDYTKPLFKGKLEAGVQAHITFGSSTYNFDDYNFTSENWVNDTSQFNEFTYDRSLYSAYGTYSNSFKGFTYQFGLRLEQTQRLINQITMDEKYNLELFNYYPTIHISKEVGKTNQFQASYTRRINRPQPWELNPFSDYSDSYNTSYGNPLLEPEDVDSYEFNYLKRLKKAMFSLGLYYRQTNNTKIMSQNIEPENPNLMIVSYENLDKTYAYGTELMFNYDITKKISANIGGNYYHYEVSSVIAERSLSNNSNNWDARINASYKFSPKTKLQITGLYNGPGYQGQGYVEEFYSVNMAFRHDFLKRKATVTFNIRDVFGTSKYETVVKNDDFSSYFLLKQKTPVFRLSLSYRFNNYQRRRNIEEGGR